MMLERSGKIGNLRDLVMDRLGGHYRVADQTRLIDRVAVSLFPGELPEPGNVVKQRPGDEQIPVHHRVVIRQSLSELCQGKQVVGNRVALRRGTASIYRPLQGFDHLWLIEESAEECFEVRISQPSGCLTQLRRAAFRAVRRRRRSEFLAVNGLWIQSLDGGNENLRLAV